MRREVTSISFPAPMVCKSESPAASPTEVIKGNLQAAGPGWVGVISAALLLQEAWPYAGTICLRTVPDHFR